MLNPDYRPIAIAQHEFQAAVEEAHHAEQRLQNWLSRALWQQVEGHTQPQAVLPVLADISAASAAVDATQQRREAAYAALQEAISTYYNIVINLA